jgi:hypothetical protein
MMTAFAHLDPHYIVSIAALIILAMQGRLLYMSWRLSKIQAHVNRLQHDAFLHLTTSLEVITARIERLEKNERHKS